MARKIRLRLIETNCRRCGKPIVTANRSLWGADEAKEELGSICESCITPEEKIYIEKAVSDAVYGMLARTQS